MYKIIFPYLEELDPKMQIKIKNGTRIRTFWGAGGQSLNPKKKKKLRKKKLTSISYSTKYYIQNKYILNILYYKTHQQSIIYKISVFCFVRYFCLVLIYLFILFLQLKGHAFYLFISFLVGQYLNIIEEERQIYIYIYIQGKS